MIGTSSTSSSSAEELIQDYENTNYKKDIIKAVKILSGAFFQVHYFLMCFL